MDNNENYEIRNADMEFKLKEIGNRLKKAVPPESGYGFTFLLFEFAPGNSIFYMSSAQREDMIKVMEEMLVKLKEYK